jgi:hypothetical protein
MNGWHVAAVRLVLFMLTLGICFRAYGEGGPPLIGDDPGTPGNGKYEINIACPITQTDRTMNIDFPYVDANYGLGDHIELSYQGGLLIGKKRGEDWVAGYDASLFGLKWRFLDEAKSGADMSVYPQLGYNTTSSFARSGLAESGTSFFLPLEIAKTYGKLELDGEAGYQFYEHDRGQWAGGPIVGYLLTDKIELLSEARFVGDQTFRSSNLILDAGTRITLTDHLQLLFAAGRGLRNGDDSPHLYLYSGLGITF